MQDLRDAFRSMRANPVVTAVAILSLALGIGANTAIFSIVDSLLLRTLPVHDPERLVLITEDESRTSWTNPVWEEFRARSGMFAGVLAWGSDRFDLASGGEADFIRGLWTSGDFFSTLGVRPAIGRTLDHSDDVRGGGTDGPVAVISHRFWIGRYGGAPDAVGRTLKLDGVPFTIVGVTPPEFFGPEVGENFDVAVPLGTEPLIRGDESALDRRSTWWLQIMARLKPEQSTEIATDLLRGVQSEIRQATLPPNWRPADLEDYLTKPFKAVPVGTGTSSLRSRFRQPLLALLALVGLVLAIACANIANLLLARSAARRREMSVRLALGASRLRLARQLLVESLTLSLAGALLGVLLAVWGSRFLVGQLGGRATVFLDLGLDWRVLLFTLAAVVGTALLFGTAPALRASSVEPIEALRERGRGTEGRERMRLQKALVVAQVSLSLVLLAAAGLFLRTFSTLRNLDTGFVMEPVLVVSVDAQRARIKPEDRARFFESLRQAAASAPGVESAAASVIAPVGGMAWNTVIEPPPGTNLSERDRVVWLNFVTPEWLSVMGTPLLAGRGLEHRDRAGAPAAAVVNQAFAKRFTNGESPVGRTFRQVGVEDRPQPLVEIVGLATDAVYRSLRAEIPPTAYLPMAQSDELPPFVQISVRTAGPEPALLGKTVAAAIADVDGDLSLTFRPLSVQVLSSLSQERLVAILSSFFGGVALFMAGLGLYGVTSYAVNRRRFEIGVRMALGAAPGGVVAMVLRGVAAQVAIGFVLGLGAALWASRFAEALLFGLEPHDPITFAASAALLLAVGLAAGWLPARRASKIDPARVLREI